MEPAGLLPFQPTLLYLPIIRVLFFTKWRQLQ
jgi:hypothetical protein